MGDYLKEEIAAEAATRNLPAFANFRAAAALGDGQLVNYSTIARLRDFGLRSQAILSSSTPRVHTDHLRGLRALVEDHPEVAKRIVVSLDPRPRRTEDGIEILPARDFARALWSGALCLP